MAYLQSSEKVGNNSLILDNIFPYLDVENINTCRLVCKQWNEASTKALRKLLICYLESSRLRDFNEAFPNPDPSSIPFRSFEFENSFSVNELKGFFNKYWESIKELDLTDLIVTDDEGNELDTYNISELKGIDKLDFFCKSTHAKSANTLIVEFSRIKSVKTLFLGYGNILQLDTKISPTDLTITFNVCILNGQAVSKNLNLNLTDHVDVSNLKKLNVHSAYEEQKIIVDLAMCTRLKTLCVLRVEVIGWNEDLIVEDVKFYGGSSDISKLSSSVKYLTIDEVPGLQYSPTDTFPNIKYLKQTESSTFYYNCPNLIGFETGADEINLNMLPQTLKLLKIYSQCEFVGDHDFKLKKLIISISFLRWEYVAVALNTLKPKSLVISSCDVHTKHNKHVREILFLQLASSFKRIMDNCGAILMDKSTKAKLLKLWNKLGNSSQQRCSNDFPFSLLISDENSSGYIMIKNYQRKEISCQVFENALAMRTLL